jgi:hypothetical protein
MKKIRTAVAVAALAAVITGSALAAGSHWDALQTFFRGDTSPALEYVDATARSIQDENYTLTVDSSFSDENDVYLIVTVQADSDQAREFLKDDEFIGMDTFSVRAISENEDCFVQALSSSELDPSADNTRCFRLTATLTAPAQSIQVRLGYMEKGAAVEVPLSPAPSVTVKLNVSGVGIPFVTTSVPSTLTVTQVTLTPFTCQVDCPDAPTTVDLLTQPRIFFRMADGSIRTQSQMMDFESASDYRYSYRFFEVQDLNRIVSVIVFDMEYPLDGSEAVKLEHDAALDPFTVTRMDPLSEDSAYGIPVQELTEKLGGTCTWDPVTGDVTCIYRGVTVVLRPGDDTATVDSQPVALTDAPAVQNGVLTADCDLFFDAWGLDGFVSRTTTYLDEEYSESETIWGDWYIVP